MRARGRGRGKGQLLVTQHFTRRPEPLPVLPLGKVKTPKLTSTTTGQTTTSSTSQTSRQHHLYNRGPTSIPRVPTRGDSYCSPPLVCVGSLNQRGSLVDCGFRCYLPRGLVPVKPAVEWAELTTLEAQRITISQLLYREPDRLFNTHAHTRA